jgi:hypothetical protein
MQQRIDLAEIKSLRIEVATDPFSVLGVFRMLWIG